MRTVTVDYGVYKFDELSDDVKSRLIEKQGKQMQEDYIEFSLADDMEDKAMELLSPFVDDSKDIKVYYDLSYCQGSGAMIEFSTNNIEFLRASFIYGGYDDLLKWLYINQDDLEFSLKVKQSGHYYHENSYDYELDINAVHDCIEVGDSIDKFIEHLNVELKNFGYGSIEYYWKEDNWRDDTIEYLNENEYTECGEVWYD